MNRTLFSFQNLFGKKLACQGPNDVSLHTFNMPAFQTQNVYNKNQIYLINTRLLWKKCKKLFLDIVTELEIPYIR